MLKDSPISIVALVTGVLVLLNFFVPLFGIPESVHNLIDKFSLVGVGAIFGMLYMSRKAEQTNKTEQD